MLLIPTIWDMRTQRALRKKAAFVVGERQEKLQECEKRIAGNSSTWEGEPKKSESVFMKKKSRVQHEALKDDASTKKHNIRRKKNASHEAPKCWTSWKNLSISLTRLLFLRRLSADVSLHYKYNIFVLLKHKKHDPMWY